MEMEELSEAFLPSKHSLFLTISHMSTTQLAQAHRWNVLTLQYEAVMKAVRHYESLVPHLEEEGLEELKNWSAQSENIFRWATDKMSSHHPSTLFGEPRPQTQRLIRTVKKLFPQGLGAWCFLTMVERDWIVAFEKALIPHFPVQNLRNELHALVRTSVPRYSRCMGLNATSLAVANHPRLLDETLKQAREMAAGLDDFWNDLQSLLLEPPLTSRR